MLHLFPASFISPHKPHTQHQDLGTHW